MKSTRELFYNLKKVSKKWENYFEIYDKILPQFVGKNPTMLIIGVAQGGCIEMFSEYFDNQCTIYAIDYNKDFLDHKYDNPNVFLSCGDQADHENWNAFLKDNPKYDIIIDDGGHEMTQQIVTLERTFKHLNDDGIYVVEDTHTSYMKEWGGGWKKETSFIEYVKNLVEIMHRDFIGQPPKELMDTFPNLKSVTFYDSVTIIEKGPTIRRVEAISNSKQNPDFEWR
jgi:hypothetical protein